MLFDWLLGKEAPPSKDVQSRPSQKGGARHTVNVELVTEYLRFSLRQTLVRHTIPSDWVLVNAEPRFAGDGVAVRLVLRRPEPQILALLPIIQQDLARKLASLDVKLPKVIRSYSWDIQLAAVTPAPARAEPACAEPGRPGLGAPRPAAQMSAREHLDMLFAANSNSMHGADFAPTQPFDQD